MAQGRRALAQKLLELQTEIAPDLLKIDECKDALRAIAEETGQGFSEEIAGLGTVEVKGPRKAEFKGLVPELDADTFLALPQARQKTLEDQKLVVWTRLESKAAKPSVTVRL